MKKSVSKTTLICIILCVILAALTLTAWLVFWPKHKAASSAGPFSAAAPGNLRTVAALESKAAYGDFYVSPDGDDKNNGTYEHPFRTIAAAQKAVRKTDKQYLSHVVVSILGGTYPTDGLKFTKEDSGTDTCAIIYCAFGDSEVVFDGGADRLSESDGTALAEINGVSYFSFSGVSFVNAKGDGLVIKGSSNVNIDGCRFEQIAGRGVAVSGSRVSVNTCQISRTGDVGVVLNGGDVQKLTAGGNTVENCLISYTSQLFAEAPSASVGGVGNMFMHNEIVNSPASAVYYDGCSNGVECNYIHNTVLADYSQAAIDSPYDRWDCRANTVSGNCLNLIGSKAADGSFIGIRPCSGTEVSQNLLLNICGDFAAGVVLNGCRDVTVTNNIFVNTGAAVNGTDYPAEKAEKAVEALQAVPYQNEAWQKAYPACAKLSTDPNSEDYAAAPQNNVVSNNVSMQKAESLGSFSDGFKQGARISENALFLPGNEKVFTDLKKGIYTVDKDSEVFRSMKEFRDLPFEEIGRY